MYDNIHTLQQYCRHQKQTLPTLINEALDEEDTINKASRRTIKKRLQSYTLYLQQEGKQPNTIKNYLARIKGIYHYYDVEIPRLPGIRVEQTEHYEDLPTADEIRFVLRHTSVKMRAVVAMLASSGMRISDLCNLTVGDFMDACSDYVMHPRGLFDFLHQLQNSGELIIPTWHIPNQKTKVPYVTFNSDEATRYLVEYLLEYLQGELLNRDDLLFQVKSNSLTRQFNRLNTRLRLGQLATRGRFHPHALRKFFATSLTNHDCDFLSVEFMLGHRLDPVREAYYKADPERLRRKYRLYMEHLTFTQELEVRDVTSTELEELEELRQYRRDTDEKLRRLEEMMSLLSDK